MNRRKEYKQDELGIYFKEIGRFPVLTRKQEEELSERIKKNDDGAFDKLVRLNLRLVVTIAKKYRGTGNFFSRSYC